MQFLYAAISYPNVKENSNMYTQFIHELVSHGHEVRVIAPTYNKNTYESIEGGIPVLRVKSGPLLKTNTIAKGLNTILLNKRYLTAFAQFWWDWPVDWVLTSTPPITLSRFISRLKQRWGTKCYLILRDIFPQNAKDLGIIKSSYIFKYFRKKEQNLYKISDLIGCMSPGNIKYLQKQDPNICVSKKLKMLPNWIQPTTNDHQKPETKNIRYLFNLDGKFIALFGGNFGKPQKIDFILDLAQKVLHLQDVVFLLVGDGTEKERIKKLSTKRNLTNVIIYDRIARPEYQSLIRQADIGLVNLSEKFTIPNIPSRTLGYWDAALPILAATDSHTDLNENYLNKYNAGLWSETGDLGEYLENFMRFYSNAKFRKKMGENGRKAVEENFSVQIIVRKFLAQIGNV